ncbi:hypothetical protein [Chitinivorax sp. B]|uniref:hypothetical protein n=1 Tax=Chitinivorax sp. B TaxID=2502235 RepID=UPI0010F6A329|nr:hypothetical protein [Chitinivorax sp. B]
MVSFSSVDQFRAIFWNHTGFEVTSRSTEKIVLTFEAVSIDGKAPTKVTIAFLQPSNEWASLWNEAAQEWVDHSDQIHPIGKSIEDGFVKQVHQFKFSFGGHHQLGWSRWGFTAMSFQIVT